MATFTLKSAQVEALLFAVEKTRVKNTPELDEALERIHAALDGTDTVPTFTLHIVGTDGVERFAESFRRQDSKHLTLATRLEQKANKEAALLLDGEGLVIRDADGKTVAERGTVAKPAPKRVRTSKPKAKAVKVSTKAKAAPVAETVSA